MKIPMLSPLLLLLACASPLAAADGDAAPPAPPAPPAPAVAPPPGTLVLEFRGARLGQVLDYLSKEAGFVIANPVELAAPITLVSKQPLSPAEAVEALNGVLIDLGYVALVRGRTLHVVALGSARQQNLPVLVGSDPARIPETDVMVTQVMPVQFATAKDLAENLLPLLSSASATLTANESSNVLILTDTQAHVHRIAAIIQAIDVSVSGEQTVRVFHLAHADAEKAAQIIATLYRQTSGQRQGGQQQGGGGGRGGGGGGGFGGGGFGGGFGGGGGGAPGAAAGATATRGDVVAAADSGTNSLVIRASPGALDMLAQVIEQLDVDNSARDGVLLYRVRNGKATDLAISLNGLFQGSQGGVTTSSNQRATQNRTINGSSAAPAAGARAAAANAPAAGAGGGVAAPAGGSSDSLDLSGQVRVVADTTSNSVMVLSPERNFARLRKLLEDIDQPTRQVLVRVLVAEVTLSDSLDLGVELDGINVSTNAPGGATVGGAPNPLGTTSTRVFSNFNLFDSTLGMNGYLLQSGNFRAAVRALATRTNFDVLARPYILTTDNRQAIVNVSQEVPVINGSRTDQFGNVTSTFDRRDVGIILTVTPQINNEGRVVLDVDQELSALSDASILVAPGVNAPIINKRTMTTRIIVDHGQTAVVGGLVEDTLTSSENKVPLLGDIPLLGYLFRSTSKTKAKTELLVFLTPQVVESPDVLADLGRQLRNEMQLLDKAVEKGLLQRHLDQLANLKVGEPLPAPGAAPVAVPGQPAPVAAPAPEQAVPAPAPVKP